MISEHVYRAYLIGSPDVELSLIGGTITLDDAADPHVQADIDVVWPGHWELIPDDLPTSYGGLVWVPDDDVLEALDPRLSPRVRVTTDATYPTFSTTRYFDLGVRDRDPSQRTREVSLALASDEAILEDFAQLVDDGAPFALAGSLRAVVNYALNKAIPGAALEATPGNDADLTPYWAVTNLMPNPAARSAVGNWIPGGANGTLTRETGWTGSTIGGEDTSVTTAFLTTWAGNSGLAAGGAFGQTATVVPYVPVTPGKTYTVYCRVHSTVAKNVQLSAQIFGADGAVLSGGTVLSLVTLPANTWTWVQGTFEAPANAARIGPFLYAAPGVQWVPGQVLRTTKWMVHEGAYPVRVPWFDRATPADANYTYAESGVADASAATRTPLNDSIDPDALIWRAGTSALEFLRPLVQASGLRLVCDEQRRWTLRSEAYLAPGSLDVRYGVNLIEGSDPIRRSNGLWREGQVTRYEWVDRDGIQRQREDGYALPGATKVDLVVINAPYPGPGRSEYAVRRAQGRGREATVSLVADWRVTAEQSATIRLAGSPPQLGSASRVQFDLGPGDGRDRMSITARTSDTPEDSWLLGEPDETWLDAPSTDTWLEAG